MAGLLGNVAENPWLVPNENRTGNAHQSFIQRGQQRPILIRECFNLKKKNASVNGSPLSPPPSVSVGSVRNLIGCGENAFQRGWGVI